MDRATKNLESGLAVLNGSLTTRRAAHLLRRTQFGASHTDVQALAPLTADEAVDRLLDRALTTPLPEPPSWHDTLPPQDDQAAWEAYYQQNQQVWRFAYRAEWIDQLLRDGFRERMALFWHNHFVTQLKKYTLMPFAVQYLTILRQHALGDFRSLVREIGLTPAMLIYLDGDHNRNGAPNENYARELCELFTMGLGHYTQEDVREIARALTGWVVERGRLRTVFADEVDPHPTYRRYDDGLKTIFGRTGRFGYFDVVDLIFQERAWQTARHICDRLYGTFVHYVPDPTITESLARTFVESGFDIASVLRQLLKSERFYDEQVMGSQLKSPVALYVGLIRETGLPATDEKRETFSQTIEVGTRVLGQKLLDPPNVAGWPGNRDWLTSSTLAYRLASGNRWLDRIDLSAFLEQFPEPYNPYALARDIAQHFLAVPLDTDQEAELTEMLLSGVPDYEWDPHDPQAPNRVKTYMRYLIHLPEYQLT